MASDPDGSAWRLSPGAVATQKGDLAVSDEWAELRSIAGWAGRHRVMIGAAIMIIAEVIWKAQFLYRMYFSQDDYVNLDIAIRSHFNFRYLTLVGSGHLFPGLRALLWVLSRISLYNWPLDATVALVILAAASVAAFRLLRTLFGERPAILIPLAIYLLTPLTLPDLGWWLAAMESLPLQLAIFMALNAHVNYVRKQRVRHLVAAVVWLAIGMAFFEKGVVVPLLLFGVTTAFLTDARSWFVGGLRTLTRHWRAWLAYAVLMTGYVIVFLIAFHTSSQRLVQAQSASNVLTFISTLMRDSFIPGAVGGPWQWVPLVGNLSAAASPPATMIWLAALIAVAVIAVSILIRRSAWRAWVILAAWIAAADIAPVVLGRIQPGWQHLLGLQMRYVADSAAVLAICVGLAFWPVSGTPAAVEETRRGRRRAEDGQVLRYAAAALVGMLAFGSLWSDQAYQNETNGAAAVSSYVTNAQQAVKLAPRGTNVLDQYMPGDIVESLFGRAAFQSAVIGPVLSGSQSGKIHWVEGLPVGTIDNLRAYGSDGRLYPVLFKPGGVTAIPRAGTGFAGCWPKTHGVIVVKLMAPTSNIDWTLAIPYLWGGPASYLTVTYGSSTQQMPVFPRLHTGYLHVSGSVTSFVVSGPGIDQMCIGLAQAGELIAGMGYANSAIPPLKP